MSSPTATKPKEIVKVLLTRSERVKMVELHPKEPLVLCSLYTGQVTLWNYDTQSLVKSFDIVDLPVRCVKFITRLNSFVCGADDMMIRVFNYNTMEKVNTFEAHQDYIRCIAVHEQLPYLLTSSDDMTIKLWDWSKNWQNTMVFEEHVHYVMCVVFNPKDPTTFASASLDTTVKVWSITSPVANFTLEAHEKGVNTVEYYYGGDKPYIVTGADDQTVKIFDYQTKACIQELSLHTHNVSCALFHPDLPLLLTGSEDETISVVSTQTFRQEQTLNFGLQRVWSISAKPGCNKVAIGCDKGMVVVRLGKEEPVMCMDVNGKILISNNNEILRMEIKNLDKSIPDGEAIPLQSKEVGSCESMPQKIIHGHAGQYIAVLTDSEYTINSALAWRPKAFGQALAFVWGNESGSYAILENPTTLKTFKAFKQKDQLKLLGNADALFAGPLIGVRIDNSLTFFDWETFRIIRKIEVAPKDVVWSDSGELVAIITEASTFLLKYDAQRVADHVAAGGASSEDGYDFAFELVEEVEERIRQALWIGDCLVFVNQSDKLNNYIGGEVSTIAVLSKSVFLLGYLPKENRLFCMDRDRTVVSYQLHVSVIEYKTAIVREDFEQAAELLPQIPPSMHFRIAQFLQARGHNQLAFEITPEEDHKFDLAVILGHMDVVLNIARASPSVSRWKQLGDMALEQGYFDIAAEALTQAGDFNGLLLLYTCTNDAACLKALGHSALEKGKANIAFTCFHIVSDHSACVDVLCTTGKFAEAAFYARTYIPERMSDVVGRWKNSLAALPRVRDAIADPKEFPNLFPMLKAPAPTNDQAQPTQEEAQPAADETQPQEEAPQAQQQEAPPQQAPDRPTLDRRTPPRLEPTLTATKEALSPHMETPAGQNRAPPPTPATTRCDKPQHVDPHSSPLSASGRKTEPIPKDELDDLFDGEEEEVPATNPTSPPGASKAPAVPGKTAAGKKDEFDDDWNLEKND